MAKERLFVEQRPQGDYAIKGRMLKGQAPSAQLKRRP